MKKVIVTGCNGQLGRALNALYKADDEYSFVNTDVFEGEGITPLDITNIDAVMKMAREVKPYAIVNCAAYTNVDRCETDGDNAYRINAIGPRNLSIAATETGAKMVQISTDYVFPGTQNKALTEFDQPAPKSMYGATKYAGENFVREFADRYFMIRTAWLYGDGKNFVKTMLHLAENNQKIGVVNDRSVTCFRPRITACSTVPVKVPVHGLILQRRFSALQAKALRWNRFPPRNIRRDSRHPLTVRHIPFWTTICSD